MQRSVSVAALLVTACSPVAPGPAPSSRAAPVVAASASAALAADSSARPTAIPSAIPTAAPVPTPLLADLHGIAFSKDGRTLRAFTTNAVRVYEVPATPGVLAAAVAHVAYPEGAVFQATSPDGAHALVAIPSAAAGPGHLDLFAAETAKFKELAIPFTAGESGDFPAASISADARRIGLVVPAEPDKSGPLMGVLRIGIDVYELPSLRMLAHRTWPLMAAGGFFGARVSDDALFVEFTASRTNRQLVEIATGKARALVGVSSTRSPDGRFILETTDHTWATEEQHHEPVLAMVKDGVTGRTLGKLAVTLVDEDARVDGVAVAFCGTTARVALGTARELTVHTLPDGKVVARFPAPRASGAPVGGFACSADGRVLAVADGEDIRTIAVP